MKYYLTYSEKDKVVWGSGETKAESRKDANANIKSYSYFESQEEYSPKTLKTVPCTEEFYQSLYDNGYDDTLEWEIDKNSGVAHFVTEYISFSRTIIDELKDIRNKAVRSARKSKKCIGKDTTHFEGVSKGEWLAYYWCASKLKDIINKYEIKY